MSQKYRPYFTLQELAAISEGLKSLRHPPSRLVLYVDRFIEEIQLGHREANLTPSNRPKTMEQKLGLEDDSSLLAEEIPPDQSLPLLLAQYNVTRFAGMTVVQIEKVQGHRYMEGLMTREEEMEYERGNGMIVEITQEVRK